MNTNGLGFLLEVFFFLWHIQKLQEMDFTQIEHIWVRMLLCNCTEEIHELSDTVVLRIYSTCVKEFSSLDVL